MTYQLFISETLTDDLANHHIKAFAVGDLLAFIRQASIEAERLLIDVSEQVEWLHAYIRTVQSALQQRLSKRKLSSPVATRNNNSLKKCKA